jgi:hypothetical protein
MFTHDPDPINHQQALRSPNRAKWQNAIYEELDNLHKHSTFSYYPLPTGRKAILIHWVFRPSTKLMVLLKDSRPGLLPRAINKDIVKIILILMLLC